MNVKKAVIYARYSSHSQTEQSIEGQLRDCYEYAKREDIAVIGEYIDRAIPGKTDDRPDFQRMIADAKKRNFDYVIVWKLDRFARNRYDSAIYKHKLKQCGVRVLSAMENIGEGDESIILEAVLEASAEYYSRDLSKKVKRGKRESALKGDFSGGHCAIGYKVVGKSIVIDENTAHIIIFAFEQYAAGVSKTKIVEALKAKGIKSVNGRPLIPTSLDYALKNPRYTGKYDYNGVVMENYPAIISQDVFDKVQSRLKSNALAPAAAKAKLEYLLRGKAYCGMCGYRMVGNCSVNSVGAKYYYYCCNQRKRFNTCTKNKEKKDFLEWYVVEQTVEYVLTPERIEYIAAAVVAEYNKEFDDKAVKALERRINKIDKNIDVAVDLMIQNTNKEVRKRTETRIEELTAQKEDLEIDLNKLQAASGIRYTVEDIKLWLRQFCKGDLMDEEFRRRIIDVFVNSVYLYDDKIAIFYNLRNSKQVSYIEVMDALDGEPDESPENMTSSGADCVRISGVSLRQ